MEVRWAWPSVDLICGECAWTMSPVPPEIDERPFRRRVWCSNQTCKYYCRIFEVPQSQAITMFDTGESVPPPGRV